MFISLLDNCTIVSKECYLHKFEYIKQKELIKLIGLEYIRKLYGDTTISLAEKLGVTNAIISQWENGKKPIPEKRLSELSKIYDDIPPKAFTKELTKLQELNIEHKVLLKRYNASFEEYEIPTRFVDDEPVDFITVNEGDEGIRRQMEAVEMQIQVEKVMQEVRDIIDYQKNDHKPFGMDSFIDNRAKKLRLIKKFVSLVKNNDSIFIACIFRAIELSEDDAEDWGEIPYLDRNGLTKKVATVIKEWKTDEKKRQEAEYQEYKDLFGVDDE